MARRRWAPGGGPPATAAPGTLDPWLPPLPAGSVLTLAAALGVLAGAPLGHPAPLLTGQRRQPANWLAGGGGEERRRAQRGRHF